MLRFYSAATLLLLTALPVAVLGRCAPAGEEENCNACTHLHLGMQGTDYHRLSSIANMNPNCQKSTGDVYCHTLGYECVTCAEDWDTNDCTQPAGGKDDPHVKGFHNDFFDVHGIDNSWMNLLSHTAISVAALFSNATYVAGGNKTVHGSYMTKAAVVLRSSPAERVHVLVVPPATVDVMTYSVTAAAAAKLQSTARLLSAGEIVERGSVRVETKTATGHAELKASISLKDQWNVVVAPRVYYAQGDSTKKYAVDVDMKPLSPQMEHGPVSPHGLIGQTLDGDGFSVDGRKDDYTGSVVVTSAQGEGAIEGTISDYVVSDPFSTVFKYKRWASLKALARDASRLTGGKHSRVERKSEMDHASASGTSWW